MAIDQKLRKKRGRRLILWLVALGVAGPLGVWAYDTFGPNPPIIVSKETTRVLAPLAADGLPDYDAVILARMKRGVTPENNGAVPFWRVMWDEYEGGYSDVTPQQPKRFCQEIGLPYPPPAEDRIEPMGSDKNRRAAVAMLRERLPRQPAIVDAADATAEELHTISAGGVDLHGMSDEDAVRSEQVDNIVWGVYDRPWSRQDVPAMAEWLDRNQQQIDLLIEAAEHSDWYSPPAGLLDDNRNDLSLPLSNIQALREAARILNTRAYFHLGEERHAAAWRHAKA
ncbi:MAG: hypothetical protein AAGG46_07720, partial [Planctomycetota bacterium]